MCYLIFVPKRIGLKLVLGVALLGLAVVCSTQPTQAQTLTTLHNFTYGLDGGTPSSTLVADKQGNLYGVAAYGGIQNCSLPPYGSGCGTVFELTPSKSGWTFNLLYSFAGGTDGGVPVEESLIFDKQGNLYGTTAYYGAGSEGTVFELSPMEGGWTHEVLYAFCLQYPNCADGASPWTGVVSKGGSLYGVTINGGAYNQGAVFKLSPSKSGWTETVLYSFCPEGYGDCSDGEWPEHAVPIFDKHGNLYGTTFFGGAYDYGVVFELVKTGKTTYTEKMLYSFTGGTDGGFPYAGLIFDKRGNLYGTTLTGGDVTGCNVEQYGVYAGCGVVFELTPPSGGSGAWTETVLHSFTGDADGAFPWSGLIFDSKGNLYGDTSGVDSMTQGVTSGYGTVFKLTPSGGSWTETVLHVFDNTDGAEPVGTLMLGKKGMLYGTTAQGGAYGYGTVFALNPKK